MTNEQWQTLLDVVAGATLDPLPVGFIIDSPWLPGWAGMTLMDYFASETRWLEANLRVQEQFPQILFLPGFWSELGMCTEPASFGVKCIWQENSFPYPEKISESLEEVAAIKKPNPRTDGLTPFILKRIEHCQDRIEAAGHAIKFAVARGPLNIAAYLAGNSELLMNMKLAPDLVHRLLETVTDFLVDWLQLQATTFPSIEGVFLLDDLVGFCGVQDFNQFAKPYLKRAFEAIDAKVRFFHNDAAGKVCAPYLHEIGINLFNFAFGHSISDMKDWTGGQVALLGNIPPRDVLAKGTPDDVRQAVTQLLGTVEDRTGIILSCGGGMPPEVSTENIQAFLQAAGHATA